MRKNICICGAQLREYFQAEIIENIVKSATELDYSIQIFATIDELQSKSANNDGEASIFELINYDECCGVVIFGERIKDEDVCQKIIDRASERNIPVISIDKHFEGCYNLSFDYSNAFEEIVRHIVCFHKCKDIYVMGGIKDNDFSEMRIEVVRRVMAENGLELKADHIGYGNFWSIPCKAELNKFLDSGNPLPEAFIAANDAMAMAIIDELRTKGYNVPEDTFVTGFDGIVDEKYSIPRLTTAAQDNVRCGKLCVDIIDKVIKGGECQKDNTIPFAVRFSQSCGCEEKRQEFFMSHIRALVDKIDGDLQLNILMNNMREKLMLTKNISNIYNYLGEFLYALEEYKNCYICVEKNLLSVDAEFFGGIDNSNPNEDMILFKFNKENETYDKDLISFNKKELLPEYEQRISKSSNVIFMPLNFLDEVYGYGVFYLNNLMGINKVTQFLISLAQVFSTVKQSCEMERAFKELSDVKAEIEQLYIIDPLTGSFNRRGFYQEFAKRINNKKSGYAVIISADVDYLKHINDNYGHKEGDFAIVSLSDALRNGVGDDGIVARFGGDEYVAAIFVDKYADLQKIDIDEFMESFTKKRNETDGKPYKLQFSYGSEIAKLPMFRDIDQIIEISDDRMYEMKKEHHAKKGVL